MYSQKARGGSRAEREREGGREDAKMGGGDWSGWLQRCRQSRRLVLVIVAIALLLDNMLLTTVEMNLYYCAVHYTVFLIFNTFITTSCSNSVDALLVPIIPEFLYDIKHPNATLSDHLEGGASHQTTVVTTTSPIATTTTKCTCAPNVSAASPLEFLHVTTPSINLSEITAANLTSSETKEKEQRHRELLEETVAVGMMFASKAFVQLLANPIVGPLTHKIGYSIPMFTGFIIMFLSTLIFAFGRSYGILFLARALQGIGSSCSSVSGKSSLFLIILHKHRWFSGRMLACHAGGPGMGMLAERYQDDKERGNAMGIALGGLALGVLIGPPFGGVMYEFVGKSAPFLVLSALALGDGSFIFLRNIQVLQLLMLQPSVVYTEAEPPSLKSLITDPYIVLAADYRCSRRDNVRKYGHRYAGTEPTYLDDGYDGCKSLETRGHVFTCEHQLPDRNKSFRTARTQNGQVRFKSLFGRRYLFCKTVRQFLSIPLAKSIDHLIVPNAGLGFAIGMVDSSMMPELGYLVDIRHTAVYGSVYAIGDVAFCLGFAIGPALSGTLVNSIGFEWMLFGIAILNFIYAPLMYFLRAPPTKEEKKSLIIGEKSSVRYVTYQNEEEDQ
ncbi:Synaptic vesicular amine transporter [Cyphomyrmex costatus]|uniref:Synaptic vesicular amine transporter n=1 Tax=Cyphomyrmex costatus TaxID=456900 RepID=A0A151ILX3_9HYME|nr:Synaptic vesicular amine transporter [Cyphomyrmex costatus]